DGSHQVTFEKRIDAEALTIRKVYTLGPKDYHVGLRLEFVRAANPPARTKTKFRVQMAGPRGMPVEGEWYSSTPRVALIGWENPGGAAKREYEDAATITLERGGRLHNFSKDNRFKYAAITTQFFASALAIDDRAE